MIIPNILGLPKRNQNQQREARKTREPSAVSILVTGSFNQLLILLAKPPLATLDRILYGTYLYYTYLYFAPPYLLYFSANW